MNRIYHTWDKWECYKNGFYEVRPPNGMSKDEAENIYMEFLSNLDEFKKIAYKVVTEWTNSCEHYLSNENMNRIAWIGQASLAYKYKIPSCCRGGYHKLSEQQQKDADLVALDAINYWLFLNGEAPHSMESIKSKTQQNLY